MTDHANIAAAVTAGYLKTQVDRGAGFKGGGRYWTQLEKTINDSEAGSFLFTAHGESNTDQTTADTNAINALNAQRGLKYGLGATAGTKGNGKTLTFDK